MRVVVLGSGLIAISTAYFLRAQGAEVAVLGVSADKLDQGNSYWVGAGLMSPGQAAPVSSPGAAGRLTAGLLLPGAALGLKWRALPGLLPWGAKFLRNASPTRFTQNLLNNARLSLYSQYEYHKLVVSEDLQFEHSPQGTLALFRSPQAMSQGVAQAHFLKQVDIAHEQLTTEQLIVMEPALEPIAHRLAGALHFPDDETANAEAFYLALKSLCTAQDVDFYEASAPLAVDAAGWRKRRHITAVDAGSNLLAADAFVIAADGQTSAIARQLGVPLGLATMISYTTRLDLARFAQAGVAAPRYPVVDSQTRTLAIPLQQDGKLRVIGLPELRVDSMRHDVGRAQRLSGMTKKLYPGCGTTASDAMPMVQSVAQSVTADGVPIIGGTPVANVFVNTGHGLSDWTMACGSAAMVAGQVMQSLGNWQLPKTLRAMDLSPFTYRRR